MGKNGLRVRLGGAVYGTTLALAVGFATSGSGVAYRQVATGEPDPELGRRLFNEKGCIGCHTLGEGRLIGPDLGRVTQRRSDAWTVGMITAPDSMLREDATAQSLLETYVTRMPDLNVRPYEASALVAYLRAQSDDIAASETGRMCGNGPRNPRQPHHGAHHQRARSTSN